MTFFNEYGYLFVLAAVLSELMGPFILAKKYPHYHQLTMLISDFGEAGSPVRTPFKIWQFVDGVLFMLAIPSFSGYFYDISPLLSCLLGLSIGLFALGDCIFTAIFDRVEGSQLTFQGALHDYGSGVGFVALLMTTVLFIRLYLLEHNRLLSLVLLVIFFLSGICMLVFASPRIPIIRRINVSYRGFWQRANLFFLYLPLLIVVFYQQGF